MIVSVYCRSCRAITRHGQFYESAHGIPETYIAGSECFKCEVCCRPIYANEAWTFSLEDCFRLESTTRSHEEIVRDLESISVKMVDQTLQMYCHIAAKIIGGKVVDLIDSRVVCETLRLNGGVDRYGSYVKGLCREAVTHLIRWKAEQNEREIKTFARDATCQ
jgi:hypothetical protein